MKMSDSRDKTLQEIYTSHIKLLTIMDYYE